MYICLCMCVYIYDTYLAACLQYYSSSIWNAQKQTTTRKTKNKPTKQTEVLCFPVRLKRTQTSTTKNPKTDVLRFHVLVTQKKKRCATLSCSSVTRQRGCRINTFSGPQILNRQYIVAGNFLVSVDSLLLASVCRDFYFYIKKM